MQIERLKAENFEEAIDFTNMVFSMAHCPFDFVKFLPRLYKPTDECMGWNLAVRENGRIRGLVGMYPDVWQVGDTALKLGGIGAVSAHPRDHGKGWMKLLMEKQVETMRQEGYDISFLAGQRQRYMYFGYERTGTMLEYRLNPSNMKHLKGQEALLPIRFEPMQATDVPLLAKAKALLETQPMYCQRSLEEFYLYLLSSVKQPWAALRPDGSMAGYLTANPEHSEITEIFAEDADSFAGMVCGWFAQQNLKNLKITLPSWAEENARYLGTITEDVRLADNCSWRIYNWPKVVNAFLQVKHVKHHLAEGTLRIGIQDYGVIRLSVGGGKAACELTAELPDVEWDALTATRILFGHVPPTLVAPIPQELEPLLASWLPLPLSWLLTDYV